jgi:hypothetical protein
MGWSAGEFKRVHDWTDDETAGYNIEASRMDAEDDNFATGINACRHLGGSNAPTANLPMGGYIHTGVGTGTARNHYASLGVVQDGGLNYAAGGGTANAQTVTLSPAISSYTTGMLVVMKAGATNTDTMTLNVNGIGAKSVWTTEAAATGYEIVSGGMYYFVYDGSKFRLLNPNLGLGCVVSDDSGQTLATPGTGIYLTWDTEEYDTNMHSTSSNTEKFNILRSGCYTINATAEFYNTGAEDRAVYIVRDAENAQYVTGGSYSRVSGGPILSVSGILYCTVGQYIRIGAVNVDAVDQVVKCHAAIHLIGY